MAQSETRNSITDLIMVDADLVRSIELERARKARYEQQNPGRNKNPNRIKNSVRPFIAWDGEGPRDAGYALFGSSEGDEICHPFLETKECLELILSREEEQPEGIHVWFGSNYDVSMILKDLPWRALSALKHWNRTVWQGYEIEHIPHKWLEIKKHGIVAKLFDVQSFFGGSYVRALLDMNIGTETEIAHLTSEKARRSEFLWAEIDEIREYWRLELALMPMMMERLRTAFLDAGFDVQSWHGPGALANMAMRRHNVFEAMCVTPPDVQIAARFAFAGGRFELFRGGYIRRKVYNGDLNSAYPAFTRNLPNLSRGNWRRGRDYETGKFAVYRIRYRSVSDPMRAYPLFRRLSSGEVVWPSQCEGWYWGPEAELVANDPDATFLESWVFDEDDETDRPFAWLEEYYYRRQRLKSQGSILELTFKLVINSVYGQLAQRTGWDRKNRRKPNSHQLEWAGYITASCRAAVYRAAISCGDDLISIDTDGIYSLAPIGGLLFSKQLGDWSADEYDEGIFFQSGIYSLRTPLGYDPDLGYGWEKGKTRGIPKGKFTTDQLMECVIAGKPMQLSRKAFIGYGLALNGQREALNTWTVSPVEIRLGGQGKRYHNVKIWCGKHGHCADGIHEFVARPVRFTLKETVQSEAHSLPWLGPDPVMEARKRLVQDSMLYDVNNLEPDDEWITELATV
jgi:hypothetical protein